RGTVPRGLIHWPWKGYWIGAFGAAASGSNKLPGLLSPCCKRLLPMKMPPSKSLAEKRILSSARVSPMEKKEAWAATGANSDSAIVPNDPAMKRLIAFLLPKKQWTD